MTATYEMQDGQAVPCEYYGPERRRPIEQPSFKLPRPMSKRETRRAARAGGKRRRFWTPGTSPRRYRPADLYVACPATIREIGHWMSDGAREVYLPEGERVGPKHSRALAHVLGVDMP